MLIENIPKSSAELYQKLLSELKPNWNVEIIEEDYNLYRLGFSDEIRCSLHLDISHEQIHGQSRCECMSKSYYTKPPHSDNSSASF